MLSLPCGLVFGVALLLSFCCVSSAQVPDPVTSAMAPQPGDGHHYIGVGAETVNPADGSLTFDLPINTPPGRGLNFPFGIRYSSPVQFMLRNLGTDTTAATMGQLVWNGWSVQGSNQPYTNLGRGWQYELPSLAVQYSALYSGTITEPRDAGDISLMFQCDVVNNYMFRGFDGREYPLMIAQLLEDPTAPFTTSTDQSTTLTNMCNPEPVDVSNIHGVLATAQIVTGSPGIPIDGANVNVYDQSGTEYQFGGFLPAGGGIPTIG
jgi:hypothetical protein